MYSHGVSNRGHQRLTCLLSIARDPPASGSGVPACSSISPALPVYHQPVIREPPMYTRHALTSALFHLVSFVYSAPSVSSELPVLALLPS
ncbi:hypothetical protein BCR37DRAFT_380604 [Protomyces lactucae-debilis]|uniref:Uncharacterized protein n=1 Tax=Protomyces lactucae-debilis TaxID=2754530 RepID=A0A1Y2FA80_PROLT|nr:uncharacterized protein BCR37DRAFT_380604 [Protomyces lactucae-debilis]ORY80830.1 hypothetical protein BCR37DRAFT_380604 [Protomyces lactucae-debilis]